MFFQYQRLMCAAAVLASATAISGTTASKDQPRAELISVQPFSITRVRMIIRNPMESAVYIPYCDDRAGTKSLCTLAIRLEVQTGSKWRPAQQVPDSGILGGVPITKGSKIDPRGEDTYEYEFDSLLYKIDNGAQLRLVLDVWRDEQTMRSEKPALQIATDPFELPAVFRRR